MVVAICSGANAEMVKKLSADEVCILNIRKPNFLSSYHVQTLNPFFQRLQRRLTFKLIRYSGYRLRVECASTPISSNQIFQSSLRCRHRRLWRPRALQPLCLVPCPKQAICHGRHSVRRVLHFQYALCL
jgi:hypothetical protein